MAANEEPQEEFEDDFKLNFKLNDQIEEDNQEYHDRPLAHWAHMAFALGAGARGF